MTWAVVDIRSMVAGWLRQESLRERPPVVWQVRTSLSRDPKTKRYEYVTTRCAGAVRVAQREAPRLVKLASEGRLSTERKTLARLLQRPRDTADPRDRRPAEPARHFRCNCVYRSTPIVHRIAKVTRPG